MTSLRFALASSVLLAATGCSAGADSSEGDAGTGGTDSGTGATGGATMESTGGSATGGALSTGGVGTGGVGPGAGGSTGGGSTLPPLEECETASIDRFQEWQASGEGPTTPATGSLLVADGDGYVAQASFTSSTQWHVLAVWFGNEFGASFDFTGSTGFTLTYSATDDFYFQLRPAAQWSGGAKWHMPIPSTSGEVVTAFFPFEAAAWEEVLGTPPHTLAEAMADASGFAIVDNDINELTFHGLRIDGFTPNCL